MKKFKRYMLSIGLSLEVILEKLGVVFKPFLAVSFVSFVLIGTDHTSGGATLGMNIFIYCGGALVAYFLIASSYGVYRSFKDPYKYKDELEKKYEEEERLEREERLRDDY